MVIVFSILFAARASAARDVVAELEDDLKDGRYAECVRAADADGVPPRASYLGGLCSLKLNEWEEARPFFERAKEGGFRPSAAWRKTPDQLLSDLAEYRRLAPAPAALADVPAASLIVGFDRRTPWVDSVAAAAPEFVRIGRRVFGAAPPFTRLFLFSDFDSFEKFYRVVFGPAQAHGTGGPGLAVMAEKKARDRRGGAAVGVVLHELTHAWIQGYGRDGYGKRLALAPWADEGIADYVGAMWDTDMFERRRLLDLPREVAKHPEPPDFARLQKTVTFHAPEDDFLDYGLSLLLVERLVGPPDRGAPALRRVLDAYGSGLDDEEAWRSVTGKSPSVEYAALCSELWKNPPPRPTENRP